MTSLSNSAASFVLPQGTEALERVAAPSLAEFRGRYLRPSRPVVVTGLTEGWLPGADWTPARVAERYGEARVVAAVLADGTLLDDAESGVVFHRVHLGEFVKSMAQSGHAGHYVMAPVSNLPERFRHDYRVPSYCQGAPHLRAKFWVGKAGTVTPTHRDVPHNLNVHLSGLKVWRLFPPGSAGMYPRGIFSGMPNFSQVDPERPDDAQYPRFGEVRCIGGVVRPGEALFIPHGWWHHTRTLEDAVAMNFWWGGRAVYLASWASTLFKKVRGIRQDEWAPQ